MGEQRQETRLRAVVDTAVDGVILIDAEGVVFMAQDASGSPAGKVRKDLHSEAGEEFQ